MIAVKVSGISSAYQLGKHFPLLTPSVLIAFLKQRRTHCKAKQNKTKQRSSWAWDRPAAASRCEIKSSGGRCDSKLITLC